MKFRLPVLLFYSHVVAGLMICSLLSGGSVSAQGSTPATVTGVLNDAERTPDCRRAYRGDGHWRFAFFATNHRSTIRATTELSR